MTFYIAEETPFYSPTTGVIIDVTTTRRLDLGEFETAEAAFLKRAELAGDVTGLIVVDERNAEHFSPRTEAEVLRWLEGEDA